MKLQINDPRLLQYVLDEISSADRQLVEVAISNQSEIRAEVEELKRVYGTITEIESNPKDMSLSAERRQKLFQQTIHKNNSSGLSWLFDLKKLRYFTGGLIAATFAFLVFNHSLKKEVRTADISNFRPNIPADSEMVGIDPKRARLMHSESPPSGSIKKSKTETLAAKDNTSTESSELPAMNAAPFEPVASKRDFIQDKEEKIDADESMDKKTKGVNPVVHDERSQPGNLGLLSAFGNVGAKEKIGSAEKGAPLEKLQVQISSRALEAEQIKTMTAFITACLNQNKISRELQIIFEPQDKKYSITNANSSAQEKKFADCAQGAFVQPLAPYIKTITVELKAVSK